ncbi:MAG: family 78 glycoside hydrolase catalytic domain [Bacteroidota bacterium]
MWFKNKSDYISHYLNINFMNPFIKTLILFTIISILFSCSINKKVEVVDLKCEYLENPLGIDIKAPRLSWRLKTDEYNIKQKAYRILVSTTQVNLENNIGDLWDSDTVFSDRSTQIEYDGIELLSRQKGYWKVQVWDQNNLASSWSEISSWEMALLNKSEWKASWIGKEENHKVKAGQKNPAPYFRKNIVVENNIRSARVYISGLGYYELYINGEKVGDHLLSPNQTNYDKRQFNSFENGKIANMSTRVLYETYDISKYLEKGENKVEVVLGNGWYYQTERSEYLPLYFDTPRFIAQFEIEETDGKKQIVISDKSWKIGNGPIVDNNLYHGEIYDARLEEEWHHNDFDDSKWKNAKLVRAPEGELRAQMSPPDRVISTIKPVSISERKKGVYRYDFGTMFSGWIKLKISGNRGDEIKLTYFEDNGNSYEQSDTYILKGEGNEEWEPRFTWHSFRYVDIESSSVEFDIDNIEGRIVNTDVESAGTFESSNELFNRILYDYRKTQLGNMHGGVPSDCPHRERRGYTGDGQISAQAAIYNFDMKSFFTKWINDISDGQNKKTGYVPNTIPYHSGGGGVAWGSAIVIIPWYMYLYYGDVAILEEHYSGMKQYIDYLKNRTDKDGLIYINKKNTWDLGEWVPPDVTEIPPSFVSSAYYYYDLSLAAQIAEVIGKKAEADLFLETAKELKESFNKRYLNIKEFSYSIGRQGANVFPLAFGLVPEEMVNNVFQTLVQHIEINTKGHFDTGMMGTPYLLEVLTRYGRPDLAYTVMNRRDYPSFGYNIERGATTLWETWTGEDSHSHPMFGSVTAWFYQGLGGINPDPKNPGYRHIIIKPNIVTDLNFVNTSYSSDYGMIISNWELEKDDYKLSISIPPNTTASIYVLGNKAERITVDNSNADFIGIDGMYSHYEVPSGEYIFVSKNIDEFLRNPMLSIPVIEPSDSILYTSDSLSIRIYQYSPNAEIRYTIDGSEPNENSTLYNNSFILKQSTTIKAKVFKHDVKPGYSRTSQIVFIDSLNNGLNYKYYLGKWEKLPDFKKLEYIKVGKVSNIDLNEFADLDNQFGIVFSGELKIISSGVYKFYLNSNDGSKLYIDGDLIVDSDGLHGFSGSKGEINLTKGKHKIRVEYFQAGGGKGLELLYEGPNTEKQRIPADKFFFDK